MLRRLFFCFLLVCAANAQTKLSLNQLPNCAITGTTPTSTPIILAIVPAANGTSQFACYTLAGVSIQPGSGTPAPAIVFPTTVLPVFVDAETPSGTVDGNNAAFTLAHTPTGLQVWRNGLLQKLGLDYNSTGAAITFVSPPASGDVLLASYRM